MSDHTHHVSNLQEVTFVSAGQFTAQEPWRHPVRTIGDGELIYVLRGRVEMAQGDTVFAAEPGQWLWLCPGVEHRGVGQPRTDVRFWWFHLALPSSLPWLQGPVLPLPDTADTERLTGLARQLLYTASTAIYPAIARDMLARLMLIEIGVLLENAPHDPLLSRVAEWIRINRDTPLTAGQVAAHFGYDRDYLSRRCKQALGMGLKEYIIRQRMDLARQLLLDQQLPLRQVAAQVGYRDYKLFLKAFTYHQGMTPTQYRQTAAGVHTNKA
ncbi:MAG: helix-turn-helix transcriptional regulator [Ruminococcaceae bacterium]|nr:helix-turn-helix transcriptional regulator [Oscillospiraceae bacterium]